MGTVVACAVVRDDPPRVFVAENLETLNWVLANQLVFFGQQSTVGTLVTNLSVVGATSITSAGSFLLNTFLTELNLLATSLNTVGSLNQAVANQVKFNDGVQDADDFPVDEVGQFAGDFVADAPVGKREDEILNRSSGHGPDSLSGFGGTDRDRPDHGFRLPFHRAASASEKRWGLSSHRQAL